MAQPDTLSVDYVPITTLAESPAALEVYLSPEGTFAKDGDTRGGEVGEASRCLAAAILQRIEARLPGRVRNLAVHVTDDTVVLEGKCATYYTKQLAQHAALGVLEDEHLENAIVVSIGG
jgi:hypothetical protein